MSKRKFKVPVPLLSEMVERCIRTRGFYVLTCEKCGAEIETVEPAATCPKCGVVIQVEKAK